MRPLSVGDDAPPFAGMPARVPFVIYFYPEDETPGCIAQACAFRDSWDEFLALGVQVFGVSRDDATTHAAFATKRRLPFALLPDEDGSLHRSYGAFHFGGIPRRVSYLVDARGKIAAVFDSHLKPASHSDMMLEAARRLVQ